jgi:hypothetical protein
MASDSNTNDTSAIDDKKTNQSNNKEKSASSKITSYIISLITVILIIIMYFMFGGLILFLCKLAQSNILPTEMDCAPYTDNTPNIESVKTNIFPTNDMSMKMEFPHDSSNIKNSILDMFKKYKDKPNSFFLANYFISIIESIMAFDYTVINSTMNLLNGMPETVIVGIGPIIASFMFSIGVLLNGLYFMYLWFANMYWFFYTNANENGEGKPEWDDVTIASPVKWCMAVGFPLISLIPFFTLFYVVFSCFFYKGLLNGKGTNGFSLFIHILKNYKVTIVSVISLFVVLLSFSNLGAIPGLFSILVLAFIYWGIISIDIFKPINEGNLTPLVSYEQAKKTCSVKSANKKKHGLLYNLLIGQKGGNHLTKELKKLSKSL